jgi:Ca2+-binding RTX toxin-like protein
MNKASLGRPRHARRLATAAALVALVTTAAAHAAVIAPLDSGTTGATPAVTIDQVSVLGPSTARVQATADTSTGATTIYFRYGDGSVLDQRTPNITLGAGLNPADVIEDLLDLQPGSSYNIQAVIETPLGPITSNTVPFTLPAAVFVNPTTGAVTSSGKKGTRCTIVGTAKRNRLVGTKKRDVICGLGGNDSILGRGGNDLILAGTGNDRASGGAGRDRIYGNSGRDRLYGNRGRDRLYGNGGSDRLNTASNRRRGDYVSGGAGRDRASVNRGDRVSSVESITRR